jgi:hypothetical protein
MENHAIKTPKPQRYATLLHHENPQAMRFRGKTGRIVASCDDYIRLEMNGTKDSVVAKPNWMRLR